MKYIINYIKKYRITYISVVLIFVLGMIIGLLITFKIPENDKIEIQEYVKNSVTLLKEHNVNKQGIFKDTLISNVKLLGIVWVLGCTVIASFTIYILMIYKGFLIGYIISIIISIFGLKQGVSVLFPIIILHNIILLPLIFLLATSGIRMYKLIVQRNGNIKYGLITHTVIMLICLIFAIISSCIESYFSTAFFNIL